MKTEYERWISENGEELRFAFDLNKNSIVWDIGGFSGDWTARIYSKYRCNVFIFEPVEYFFHNIKARFKNFPNIHAFNAGLAEKEGDDLIHVRGDESTQMIPNVSKSVQDQTVAIKTIAPETLLFTDKYPSVIRDRIPYQKVVIDLMKMNIEGAEYDLLQHMIDKGITKHVHGILVQFHRNVPDYEKKYKRIAQELSKTHTLQFRYDFIWEYWQL